MLMLFLILSFLLLLVVVSSTGVGVLVNGFTDLHGGSVGTCNLISKSLNFFRSEVLVTKSGSQSGEFLFDFCNNVSGELAFVLVKRFFSVVENLITFVLQINEISSLLIFFLVSFSFTDHFFHLSLGETTRRLNNDVLHLTSTFVLSSDVDETRLIDIEDNFDLRNTLRSRGNISKIELTKELVLSNHGSLTLEDSDGDNGLVISSSRENLRFFSWDGSISLYHLSHDTTVGFNSESKRGNIEKNDVLD